MNTVREKLTLGLQTDLTLNLPETDRVPAAVIVPFFEKDNEPHLLFTKRTSLVHHHRGEICFPGGSKEEQDADLRSTALRELYEEVAVSPEQIELVGNLKEIKTYSSSFIVVPYVGFVRMNVLFHPNVREVEEILEIPFKHFQDPSISRKDIRVVDHRQVPVYYYQWRSHTIWGLTGRILKNLLDLLSSGSE